MLDTSRKRGLWSANCRPVKTVQVAITLGLVAVLPAPFSAPLALDRQQQPVLVADSDLGEVRLLGHVQKTRAPRMTDWGAKHQALLGTRDGDYHDDFVFLVDARVSDIYKALLEVGADPAKAAEGEMRATLVDILIQWTVGDRMHSLPYQGFFQQSMPGGEEELIAPWEPRFVFHGMGAEREVDTGCIACPAYCPGGIIGDQVASVPMLRADWEKLPRPGTEITAAIRISRSQVPSQTNTIRPTH